MLTDRDRADALNEVEMKPIVAKLGVAGGALLVALGAVVLVAVFREAFGWRYTVVPALLIVMGAIVAASGREALMTGTPRRRLVYAFLMLNAIALIWQAFVVRS